MTFLKAASTKLSWDEAGGSVTVSELPEEIRNVFEAFSSTNDLDAGGKSIRVAPPARISIKHPSNDSRNAIPPYSRLVMFRSPLTSNRRLEWEV